MNKAGLVAAASFALVLGACGRAPAPAAQAPLAGARIGGPFALTDQDGRPFSSAALKGRYAVVYFGYTFCPDVCPTDMLNLAQALKGLEKSDPALAAKVQPVFITVDPARDTPAVLKRFVRAFHPRLIGLTGTPDQIAAVAKEYATTYQKQDAASGTDGYLMQHMSTAILFGPKSEPIALVPVDESADAVAATFATWVR